MSNLINMSVEEIAYAFCDDSIIEQLKGCKLLASYYEYENYEGSAFVLYENSKGALYVVEGGHCSCYGLEGQWEPGVTSWKALDKRYFYCFDAEFKAGVQALVQSHLN